MLWLYLTRLANASPAEIIDDLVCTVDGHSYERAAIEKWFRTRVTSPKTGAKLGSKLLVPNIALRQFIRQYLETRPELDRPVQARRGLECKHPQMRDRQLLLKCL